MKNILAIEIKDNKTIATFTRFINGEHNLLLHKTYGSRPLSNLILYDISIIDKIKQDLLDRDLFEIIDDTFLTINTKRTITHTFNLEFKYNTNLKLEKKKLVKNLEDKHPNFKVVNSTFSNIEKSLTKQDISATIELIGRDYIKEIINQFKVKGIVFTKYISLIKSINNSTNSIKDKYSNLISFSILVEEKFTQLTMIKNGVVASSFKWSDGLTNIYQHISKSMNIDKQLAKELFKSFGSIPPEDVVDDKIIHSRKEGKELIIFTKKDLSRYITEIINELFSNVKSKIELLGNKKNLRIIFNGEIKSLTGFKKYASKSFAEPNIKSFSTNIIGLNEETEFITEGILKEVKQDFSPEYKKEELNLQKNNIFNKIIRMYNYI